MEVVVHLGSRHARVDSHGALREQPRLLLGGQLVAPLLLRPGRVTRICAIRFQPWGAATLLAMPFGTAGWSG